MKKNKIFKGIGLVVCGALVLTACQKRKLNKETTTSKDNALAQSSFNDIFNTTDKFDDTESDIEKNNKTASLSDTSYTHPTYNCLTITKEYIDVSNWERKITLDFGSTGCVTGDGRTRKGKIIAHRIGRYYQTGSTHTITTEDYFVDDYEVIGERVVTNLGENGAGNKQYKVEEDGEIKTPDNEIITWNSTRTRTWVEGTDTWVLGTLNSDGSIDSLFWNFPEGLYDDVWEVTGTADGINREGRTFDMTITTPLRVAWCQPYLEVTEGVIEIQPEDLDLRTVDYGDQNCDNEASVSIGSNSYTFALRNY